MPVSTVSAADLKVRREQKKPHLLLDVREPEEHERCRIEGSLLIPLSQLRERACELPKDKEIVVYCHHGGRSAQAAAFLADRGFMVANLAGGIDAWSEQVDPSLPRY